MHKVTKFVANLHQARRTFALIWVAAPRWTIAWGVLLLLQGCQPLLAVYLTKLLVDSLVQSVSAGNWQAARGTLLLVGFTVGVLLLGELLQGLSDLVRTSQSELVQDHIKGLVHEQSARLDLGIHESPEYQDQLDRARSDAATRPMALLESTGGLIQNSITLAAMTLVLAPFGIVMPLILLASTVPALCVVLLFDRRYHEWWQKRTAERRWAQYYDLLLTHNTTAAELRLFGLTRHFRVCYQELRRLLRHERLQQIKTQSIAKLMAGAFAQLIAGATLAWMMWRALNGGVTLGDLALFYQAFNRGQALLRSLLGNIGQIYNSTLFLENLFSFLDLQSQIKDPEKPLVAETRLSRGIEFRNITFRYPGATHPALKDFNLFIPAGKIVAIVGANGAGKTTLLKMLCRFYEPERGSIELDGVDIKAYSLEELRKVITVLFQFPINFQATAETSIALGDLAGAHPFKEIQSAASDASIHDTIVNLPRGYQTQLGRTFADGVELSGGEWQRIATARAYLRRSPIVILDEPTSMMDSWAEAEWFGRFRSLTQNRTAIVITHRFSIAMRADVIHVMDDGQLVESGSHRELVLQNGLYAASWQSQMQAAAMDKTIVNQYIEAPVN